MKIWLKQGKRERKLLVHYDLISGIPVPLNFSDKTHNCPEFCLDFPKEYLTVVPVPEHPLWVGCGPQTCQFFSQTLINRNRRWCSGPFFMLQSATVPCLFLNSGVCFCAAVLFAFFGSSHEPNEAPPRFPPPGPPHLFTTLGSQFEFWRLLFRKRDLFWYCKNPVLIRNWKLFLYQMVSGHNLNLSQIKCCPGLINSNFHSNY